MPISKDTKNTTVAKYVELLGQSDGFIVFKTQGLAVSRVEPLRLAVRKAGGLYVVGKNTLLTKALEQQGWAVPDKLLVGPTSIAIAKDNFPGLVRGVLEYLKKENFEETQLKLVGGVLGGQEVFGESGIEAVSQLPTLPELQAQLIGLVVQPATGLVTVIDQATAGIVNVLQAWIDKREKETA